MNEFAILLDDMNDLQSITYYKILEETNEQGARKIKKGKRISQKIQLIWLKDAGGDIIAERHITKPSGRRGRIDVFVDNAGDNDSVAVLEIKYTDWDAMTPKAVRRNINRHSKQLFDYIDSQLDAGKSVSPGIIYPKQPKDSARMQFIEDLFDEMGIPVVWEDESIEESKKRLSN